MAFRRKLGIAAIAMLAAGVVFWFAGNFRDWVFIVGRGAYFAVHRAPRHCKERAAEFTAKVELIRRDTKDSLRVGTRKDDVARFFASERISLTDLPIGQDHYATGTQYFKGLAECENFACGDDAAMIGVRVKVDADGTVVSEPVVTGMYTDCL